MRASTEEGASRARAQPREGSTHLLQAHCLQRGCLVWRQERVCDRLLCLVEQSEDLLLQGSSGLLGQNRHSKTTMRKELQEPMLPDIPILTDASSRSPDERVTLLLGVRAQPCSQVPRSSPKLAVGLPRHPASQSTAIPPRGRKQACRRQAVLTGQHRTRSKQQKYQAT